MNMLHVGQDCTQEKIADTLSRPHMTPPACCTCQHVLSYAVDVVLALQTWQDFLHVVSM